MNERTSARNEHKHKRTNYVKQISEPTWKEFITTKTQAKKKADENTFILNCGKSNTITTRKFQKPCINQ